MFLYRKERKIMLKFGEMRKSIDDLEMKRTMTLIVVAMLVIVMSLIGG